MRDIWIASAVLLAIILFIRKNYIWLCIPLLFIAFVRFGSIVFFALPVLVIFRERMLKGSNNIKIANVKFLVFLVTVLIAFYLAMPIIRILSDGRLDEGLLRLSIVEYLKTDDENAVIVKILNLPFPLNFIFATIFFFFLPFLRFEIYTFGVFNNGNLFGSIFTPLFFFPLWKYLVCTFLKYWKENDETIRPIVLFAVLIALALGTVSLQARHKTVLIPFMCMMIAYGKYNYMGKYRSLSTTIGTIIILFEIAYALMLIL